MNPRAETWEEQAARISQPNLAEARKFALPIARSITHEAFRH